MKHQGWGAPCSPAAGLALLEEAETRFLPPRWPLAEMNRPVAGSIENSLSNLGVPALLNHI